MPLLVCQGAIRSTSTYHLFTTLDYAAASILGESLGYKVLTIAGEEVDFQTRQAVMMVPVEMKDEIQSYIYERK